MKKWKNLGVFGEMGLHPEIDEEVAQDIMTGSCRATDDEVVEEMMKKKYRFFRYTSGPAIEDDVVFTSKDYGDMVSYVYDAGDGCSIEMYAYEKKKCLGSLVFVKLLGKWWNCDIPAIFPEHVLKF